MKKFVLILFLSTFWISCVSSEEDVKNIVKLRWCIGMDETTGPGVYNAERVKSCQKRYGSGKYKELSFDEALNHGTWNSRVKGNYIPLCYKINAQTIFSLYYKSDTCKGQGAIDLNFDGKNYYYIGKKKKQILTTDTDQEKLEKFKDKIKQQKIKLTFLRLKNGFNLPLIQINSVSRAGYEKIKKNNETDQFNLANRLEYSDINQAILAYEEFLKSYPESNLFFNALYNYGVLFNRHPQSRWSTKNQTAIFEYIFQNNTEYRRDAYERYLISMYNLHAYKTVNLDKNEKKIFRKKLCDELITKTLWKKQAIENGKFWKSPSYKNASAQLKCSQIQGGLDAKTVLLKNSQKIQTGFKIDLIENPELKKQFDKYELLFDFKNFKVKKIVSPREGFKKFIRNSDGRIEKKLVKVEINEVFDIININNQTLTMQQTILERSIFCRTYGSESKEINDLKGIYFDECQKFNKIKKSFPQLSWSLDDPYVYIDLNLKNNQFNAKYWPLSNTYGKQNFYKSNKKFNNEKAIKVAEIIFWAAAIYLAVNYLGDIKKISKGSKHSAKISKKASTSSVKTSGGFSGRTIQQKYKILKYYGYIR